MKILIAMIPMPGNRFFVGLNEKLRKSTDVVHDHKKFCAMESDFDVVHIHFPEHITFDIESCLNTDLTVKIDRPSCGFL